MRKLNALLHDVTVINFVVVAKLFTRYRKVSLGAMALAFVVIPYLYLGQDVIYQKETYFKVMDRSNEALSGKSSLVDLVDGFSYLKKPDILAILNTYDFVSALADDLIKSPGFKKFDFIGINNSTLSAHQKLKACPDKDNDCYKQNLREILPTLYAVDSELGTSRFVLVVTTHDTNTTLAVLKSFETALELTRHEDGLSSLDAEIKQVQELIAKSRSEIELKGGFDKIATSDFLNATIAQQNELVKGLADRLNQEKEEFNHQQFRLKENHISSATNLEGPAKMGFDKFDKLRKRIQDLRQNIASVSSISDQARTESDVQILKQLKAELASSEVELNQMGAVKRDLAYDDVFINAQIDNQSNFEFDYKIAAQKLRSLQADYNASKKELDRMFIKKSAMANQLLALQPDLEYLKLLESKMVAIKMKKSGLSSDVEFEHYGPEVTAFKRNSFLKIFMFSLFILSFFLFIALIVIYLCDDRIYDKEELAKCCEDLPVIGQAPHFD